MTEDLKFKPHKPQPTQPQPQPTQPQPETGAPEPKGVILLFGRGTVQYDQGKYVLIVLTPFQPHPLRQPGEWLKFVESFIRAFSISRAPEVVVAVERPQIPTILALIGRMRVDKKIRPARVEAKDGKLTYFPY
jgi:hypothetical protein